MNADPWPYVVAIIVCILFAYFWIIYLLKILRRKRLKKKYPDGFIYNDMIWVPESSGWSPDAEGHNNIPEIDQSDIPLVATLKISGQLGPDIEINYYDDSGSFLDSFIDGVGGDGEAGESG